MSPFIVAAASILIYHSIMNTRLSCKLFRNVFSTEALSHSLFSQFASSKRNLSDAQITWIFKVQPQLQKLQTLHSVEKFIHSCQKRGFTQVEIAKIIRVRPQVIGLSERDLEAKMKLLEDFGFVDRNLAKLLMINPSVLNLSLKSNLLPKMEFLKNVFQSQVALVKALFKAPILFSYSLEKFLMPSVAFWEGWGFSGTNLSSFLRVHPYALVRTSLTPAQISLIHKIDVDKTGKMFKYIVCIVAVSRVETLEAKIENLKLSGLSAEEALQLLRSSPLVLFYSKESVTEKMNFIVKNMELPANFVVNHPRILQFSLEKIMRPRFLVLQKIKFINDVDLSLYSVLRMSEARFIVKIIEAHPESKTLWAIYENALSNASNCTKSSAKKKNWMGK